MIELKQTKKGLLRGELIDRDGQLCSLQESSVLDEPCVWLGVDVDFEGQEVRSHIHLTQKMAHDLLPLLRFFARNGSLGYDDPKETFQVGSWVMGIGENNRGMEGRIVEVANGRYIVVQDNTRSGDEGKIQTLWNRVDLMWDPISYPETATSRIDRLLSNDDTDILE